MKTETIHKIFGIFLILSAFYSLNSGNEHRFLVALMLFLNGLSLLLEDAASEFLQTLSRRLRRITLVIAILLLVQLFIIG
ncbi:MAG: hypothetical protein M3033_13265 [Acidobacteriota bacterium]|nr:hypothetical protein [Acidobacteriota bacterium]